ncbi:MAG: DUF4433 domain-containing protein [Desulfamplus sp.]|nr:DUF4433 domain-containing protein [Desulfamplus sp.]
MESVSSIENKLQKYNLNNFFYFAHLNNFVSIIDNGILSKNCVEKRVIEHESFAEPNVQLKRHEKSVVLSNNSIVSLHDLVPVYLTPQTPTLYSRQSIQKDIFFAVVNSRIICNENYAFAFTDGNAGSHNTTFFNNLNDLNKIPWECINSHYWTDFIDGKRQRNAEFLIYPFITLDYITSFVVSNHDSFDYIKEILYNNSIDNISVFVNFNYFF